MTLTEDMVSVILSRPLLARIATINPQTLQPMVVPFWYLWDGNQIWMVEYHGSHQFQILGVADKCVVVIDNDEENQILKGLLVEGEMVPVTYPETLVEEMITKIYISYLGETGVQDEQTQAWIHDPEKRIYRLQPTEAYSWK